MDLGTVSVAGLVPRRLPRALTVGILLEGCGMRVHRRGLIRLRGVIVASLPQSMQALSADWDTLSGLSLRHAKVPSQDYYPTPKILVP